MSQAVAGNRWWWFGVLSVAMIIGVFALWWLICLSVFGYVGRWPGVLDSVKHIERVERVERVTPIEAWTADRPSREPNRQLILDSDGIEEGVDIWLQDHLEWGRQTFDSPWYRVLVALDRQGSLSAGVTHLDAEAAAAVDPAIRTAITIVSSANQPDAPFMRAIVIEGVDAAGSEVTVVVARGNGSGDTYPYYESVFRGSASTIGPDTLLETQRFNYDVAGLEGLGFFIQIVLLVLLLAAALAFLGLVAIVLKVPGGRG